MNFRMMYKYEMLSVPTRQKSHRVILRSSLSRIHYYYNKRLQVMEF